MKKYFNSSWSPSVHTIPCCPIHDIQIFSTKLPRTVGVVSGFGAPRKKPSLSPFSVALESSFLVFGFHRRLPPSTFGGIHAGWRRWQISCERLRILMDRRTQFEQKFSRWLDDGRMSAEAIIRAGTDIGAAARPTSERPLTVEEAVTSLVQHFLSAARAAQSRLDENEEDQAIQQDECEGVEATVSTHATTRSYA